MKYVAKAEKLFEYVLSTSTTGYENGHLRRTESLEMPQNSEHLTVSMCMSEHIQQACA